MTRTRRNPAPSYVMEAIDRARNSTTLVWHFDDWTYSLTFYPTTARPDGSMWGSMHAVQHDPDVPYRILGGSHTSLWLYPSQPDAPAVSDDDLRTMGPRTHAFLLMMWTRARELELP